MLKRFAFGIALAAGLASPAFAATSYSACYAIAKPQPGDPAVANTWGTILNTNFDLIDAAVGGSLSMSVAGASNVTLTAANGAADQARNQHFTFTGTLTGNIKILFPPSPRCGSFSIFNNTSGAFTLSIGVSNGSGDSLGVTYTVPQGNNVLLVSDGTNVTQAVSGGASPGANSDITSLSGLTTPLSVSQGGSGANTLTTHGVVLGQGTSPVHISTAGTAGQVLTSNGAGSDPTFQAASSGPTSIPNGGTGVTAFAANQLLVGTGSNTTAAKTVPNCPDTGGNHLNFNNSTQAVTCGTSSSGGGGGVKDAVVNLGTPSNGAALSGSHGLTSPISVAVFIKCTNGAGCDGGYSVNDFVSVTAPTVGGSPWYNGTLAGIAISSNGVAITPKAGSSGVVNITPSSWTCYAVVLGI